jgi:hypothetical protein
MNKAASGCQGLWWSEDTSGHPQAGHVGEGRAQAAVSSSGGKSWWPFFPLALATARSGQCLQVNYLQALMPNRRLSGSSAVRSLLAAPSGVIPGDAEGGCAHVPSGGEGADLIGISKKPSEVVCAYYRDHYVIFTFCKSLLVNCNPPPI